MFTVCKLVLYQMTYSSNFIKAKWTKFSFRYKISLADRFEDHNEVTDGLTCILCGGVGGLFLAVSYLAGVKEDPLLSHLYSNYTMKYRDSRNVVSRRFTVQLFQVAHDFQVVIKKKKLKEKH